METKVKQMKNLLYLGLYILYMAVDKYKFTRLNMAADQWANELSRVLCPTCAANIQPVL